MNISLTPEQERIVNEKIASGLYNSANEVLSEALRLLQEHELRHIRLEELRKEVQAGAEQIKQGKYKVYKSADEFMDDIEKRVSERLTERQNSENK